MQESSRNSLILSARNTHSAREQTFSTVLNTPVSISSTIRDTLFKSHAGVVIESSSSECSSACSLCVTSLEGVRANRRLVTERTSRSTGNR